MTDRGPGCVFGAFLLAIAIAPAVLIESEPWRQVAIGNAVAHLVTGFAFTMAGTRSGALGGSIWVKNLGIVIWSVTNLVALGLLVPPWYFGRSPRRAPKTQEARSESGLLPIAGARYVSRYHPRIAERRRLAA